jgi:hypothetical protein
MYNQFQQDLYAHLTKHEKFTEAFGDRLYDHRAWADKNPPPQPDVPNQPDAPDDVNNENNPDKAYMVFGDMQDQPFDTKTTTGYRLVWQFHLISYHQGKQEVHALAQLVDNCLQTFCPPYYYRHKRLSYKAIYKDNHQGTQGDLTYAFFISHSPKE